MQLISWNVNGIRAVLKKGFAEWFAEVQPDILCLQETKAREEQVELTFEFSGYHQYWCSAIWLRFTLLILKTVFYESITVWNGIETFLRT